MTMGRSARRRAGAWRVEARGLGVEGEVEGIQQGDAAQEVAFIGGEVGEGAGEECGEGAVEVGGGGGVACAADFQEAADGEVEVEGQAVGAGGDRGADVGVDGACRRG
ncbi:hypothetical protein OHU11_41820 (plasmid) [Streptomyces sp. NBC_00257]|uniref:hypothetical protein n=1 Tax=unclassified Streptomyces TaxID=2593676 RepID=UPI00225C172F|nr:MULTISPECIES: hypothetical protein [unclassified Streptomyces]MCX5434720.1 hypothetical protein [Streptomyces sp. NBC_00062]